MKVDALDSCRVGCASALPQLIMSGNGFSGRVHGVNGVRKHMDKQLSGDESDRIQADTL